MNKKHQVKRIFDSIAYRYDLLNHLLSMGIDIYWRKRAIKLSGMNGSSVLLDVACGTGDFSVTARKAGVKSIIGADLSKEMLVLFNKKAEWSKGHILQMTAEQPCFKTNTFTNITVAFGVRNFYNIPEAFTSFRRILKSGGKVTVLEFRLPENKIISKLYKMYFKKILPAVGGMISKDKEAYKYLPDSVEEFDEKVNLTELFNLAGFSKTESFSLTLGIVQIVIATK